MIARFSAAIALGSVLTLTTAASQAQMPPACGLSVGVANVRAAEATRHSWRVAVAMVQDGQCANAGAAGLE